MIDVKNSPYIVGIDLGTTNSVISVYQNNKPEIISIDGNQTTPSMVRFKDEDTTQVGEMAKRAMMIDPEHTVRSIKRKMGDHDYRLEIHGQELTPTQISSLILEHLKSKASSQTDIDLKGTIKHAVICRPANFTANQIEDTKEAALMAGFEKVWLLEEPVAAAIAYGFNRGEDQKLLIYDFGGGTFDVCVLQTGKDDKGHNSYKVLATEGIQECGGDDFDYEIMKILAEQLKEKSSIDILDEEKDQGISRKRIREAMQVIKEAAEKAKKDLSEQDAADIIIPDVIDDEGGTSHSLETELTRAAFEEMIRDKIYETKGCIESALANASLEIKDIDKILMVGGSIKVPLVREMIKEMFGEDPWSDIDPMLCVSQGASIRGASLLADMDTDVGEEDVEEEQVVEAKTNHNLGIEIKDFKFSTVVEKGVDVPVTQTKLYAVSKDSPPTIRISICQAPDEVEFVSDERAISLGEFYLKDIPEPSIGTNKVEVTFSLSEENILTVSAVCTTAEGIREELTIDRS